MVHCLLAPDAVELFFDDSFPARAVQILHQQAYGTADLSDATATYSHLKLQLSFVSLQLSCQVIVSPPTD